MKSKDKNTRFYLDIDIISKEVVNLDFGSKFQLIQQLEIPLHRIFISEGQYNKLYEKWV